IVTKMLERRGGRSSMTSCRTCDGRMNSRPQTPEIAGGRRHKGGLRRFVLPTESRRRSALLPGPQGWGAPLVAAVWTAGPGFGIALWVNLFVVDRQYVPVYIEPA